MTSSGRFTVLFTTAWAALACSEPARPAADPVTVSAPDAQPSAPTAAEPSSAGPAAGGGSSPCAGPPPGPGYECVRDCGPPVPREGDPPPGWSWLSADAAQRRKQFGCPICLPRGTKIATPIGDVPVERLRPGDPIFTLDVGGRRVATRVLAAGSAYAPAEHRVTRVRLSDGRVVSASPRHPTAVGTPIAELSPGMTIDRARVVSVEDVPLGDDRTFDVRPDGETGLYWADGILLGSTLPR